MTHLFPEPESLHLLVWVAEWGVAVGSPTQVQVTQLYQVSTNNLNQTKSNVILYNERNTFYYANRLCFELRGGEQEQPVFVENWTNYDHIRTLFVYGGGVMPGWRARSGVGMYKTGQQKVQLYYEDLPSVKYL